MNYEDKDLEIIDINTKPRKRKKRSKFIKMVQFIVVLLPTAILISIPYALFMWFSDDLYDAKGLLSLHRFAIMILALGCLEIFCMMISKWWFINIFDFIEKRRRG